MAKTIITVEDIASLADKRLPNRIVKSSDKTVAPFFHTAVTAARTAIPRDSILLFDLRSNPDGGQPAAARLARAAEKAANKIRFQKRKQEAEEAEKAAKKTTVRRRGPARAQIVLEGVDAPPLLELEPLREPVQQGTLTITPVTTIVPRR